MKTNILLPFVAVSIFSAAFTSFGANNVILFIGDGMGPAHVKAGRAYVKGNTTEPLSSETLGFTGDLITVLPNGTITDSATAGTALATGYQHPANGIISMGTGNSIKTTILELAKAKGMRTGIITTDDIGGATPGAFGAHEPDRARMAQIRNDYLWDDTVYSHIASKPNLLLGGGFDDMAYVNGAKGLGYTFVSTAETLSTTSSGLVLGLFGTSWAPMEAMAYRQTITQPTLSSMVAKALELLPNDSGFFLMVESANIDKLSHSNDKNFVWEVAELDVAVQLAMQWRASNSADQTLILLTADHETGGLSVPDQTLQTSGTIPVMAWSSTSHSAANVPIFATWPAGLAGLTLDNTEVFFLAEDGLNASTGGKPPVITDLVASGITETSAVISWTTTEPSDSRVNGFVADNARATSHLVNCVNLSPGTDYNITASSTDIAGFTGTKAVSFKTRTLDVSARVIAEPVVTLGVKTGTYQGVVATGDSITQSFTETADGVGSGIEVEYVLHTPVAANDIESLLIEGATHWTQSDGANDNPITEVRVLSPTAPAGGHYWQQITLPFQASPVASYVDGSGEIHVRFTDSASIRREKKDTLTIDYLAGTVVTPAIGGDLPTKPVILEPTTTDSSVWLKWNDSHYENGYLVWRYTATGGWSIVADLNSGTTEWTDNSVQPAIEYTYVVRAYNLDGYFDSDPVLVEITPKLVQPGNLKATVVKTGISLTWSDTNAGETGYEVLRGTTSDGNFTLLIALGSNTTSHLDKTAQRGTTYYYQVRALANQDIGPVSSTVSAKR